MKPMISHGRTIFHILWIGESISLLGTGMTRFAVMIWAYEKTGTATSLALLGFFSCLTFMIASPLGGVIADRMDRKRIMIITDLGAGLMTLLLMLLYHAGLLHIWHLYLAEGIVGVCEAFQYPAFDASLGLLLPRQEYTRQHAQLGLGRSVARIFAPLLSGVLYPLAGLGTVMAVDLATLGIATAGLLLVILPALPGTRTEENAPPGLWENMRFGSAFIFRHAGLGNLVMTFFFINLFATLTYFAVLSPMILARSGNNEVTLGIVRAVMGIGGVVGGLLVSLWGGSRHKVRAYLIALAASFLVGDFLTAISRSTLGWSIAGFIADFSIPFIVAPYYALWQELIPANIQGRVFAAREMVQVASQPLGYLFGGLLADHLFEPAMLGWLGHAFGWLVGTGPGSGMAVMFLCTSLAGSLIGILGLFSPSLHALDDQSTHPHVVG